MGKRDDYWRAYEIVKARLTVNGKLPKAKHVRDTIAATAGGAAAVLAGLAGLPDEPDWASDKWQVIDGGSVVVQADEAKPDYISIEADIDNMLGQPRLNESLRTVLMRARRIAGYEALKANNDPAVK